MARKWKISFKVKEEGLAGETIDDLETFLEDMNGVSDVVIEELFNDQGCGA